MNAITLENAMNWAGYIWLVLLGVWVVMRVRVKQTREKDSSGRYALHVVSMVVGLWLLFERYFKLGALDQVLITQTQWVLLIGLALTAAGVGLAIWARVSLGKNWSAVVTLKKDHELVRTGLYRWVRHPIYTGVLLGMVGTALIAGHLRGWLGFLIILGSFYFKARREEGMLRREFGEKFEDHAQRTGMFLPKLI
jgi:protein-S-isoprenylcysteine O-methyltransferase Ste14